MATNNSFKKQGFKHERDTFWVRHGRKFTELIPALTNGEAKEESCRVWKCLECTRAQSTHTEINSCICLLVPHTQPLPLLLCVMKTVMYGFLLENGTSCMKWVGLRWENPGRECHLFLISGKVCIYIQVYAHLKTLKPSPRQYCCFSHSLCVAFCASHATGNQ